MTIIDNDIIIEVWCMRVCIYMCVYLYENIYIYCRYIYRDIVRYICTYVCVCVWECSIQSQLHSCWCFCSGDNPMKLLASIPAVMSGCELGSLSLKLKWDGRWTAQICGALHKACDGFKQSIFLLDGRGSRRNWLTEAVSYQERATLSLAAVGLTMFQIPEGMMQRRLRLAAV